MKRVLRLVLTLALLAPPAGAAVTSNQLVTLVQTGAAGGAGVPFRQRVQFNLVLTAENVAAESTATAKHSARAQLASQILNGPDNYVTQFSHAVVAQFSLSTTNMVTVSSVPNADVDQTDAAIANTISALWNDFLPNP